MTPNSPPEHVLKLQARQRERLDGLLSFFHAQAAQFEVELPGLDSQTEEFQAKRLWCDSWGAISRGIEGILRTADGMAEREPVAAGHLLQYAVTIANGMVGADDYAHSTHNQAVRDLISTIQSEARANQGRLASRAKAE